MKKQSENSAKPEEKTNPKKRSRDSKTVTVRIPLDKYTSLQKKATEHGVSINNLLNLYIEESIGQESPVDETAVTFTDDSFVESELVHENMVQGQNYSANNFGIRYEKLDIRSSSFEGIYFKSFKWAVVANIALSLTGWYIGYKSLISAVAFPALGILWAIGLVVVGNIRKDGYRAILGWGWIAGLLSAIVVLATLLFCLENLDYSPITGLLILLAGTIFVGLLVNAPAVISIEFNKRRTRQINEHISEWGEEVCHTIINREIQPDMIKEMVLLSWGHPTAIENQEATKGYFTVEWVYKSSNKSMYVWLINGIVNKINNSGN